MTDVLSPDLIDQPDAVSPPVAQPPTNRAVAKLVSNIQNPNLADGMDSNALNTLGAKVCQEFEIDETSRKDAGWTARIEAALKLAMQTKEAKSYPWPNACYSLDTDILTRRGWVPVADVQVGEEVLSRAPSGLASYHPVVRTYRHRAPEVVHFQGKSIDLLVTPNHKMLVQDRDTGGSSFVEASEFVRPVRFGPNQVGLSRKSIPLTSASGGEAPEQIYGIDARAYMRFLGWYISEGSADCSVNTYTNKAGDLKNYGRSFGGFHIAQSRTANPKKFEILRRDIEACGFTYREEERGFGVHAKSMPQLFKAELRGLGKVYGKCIPQHAMGLAPALLEQMLDTLIAGDGHNRLRPGKKASSSYYTVSRLLADQVQEVCQRVGLRGTISVRAACAGGVINGRTIEGGVEGYNVNIGSKPTVQVLKLKRELVVYDQDVACVEVAPHNTVYVRRNGKAVWCGNSSIKYPLIVTAAIQFNARAYPAIVDGWNVVKGKVLGEPDPQKQDRADRIGRHMSYQLLEVMDGWEEETDRLLIMLPIVGCVFRKTYFDPQAGYNCSKMISPDKLVVNYWTKDLDSCPRITQVCEYYPYEIAEKVRVGVWLDHQYLQSGKDANDAESPVTYLEQHRLYDRDGDGYPEPYICTIHKENQRVVRIVARYDEDGIKLNSKGGVGTITPVQYFTKFSFIPSPDGSFYDVGFGTLLEAMNETINSTLNQLMDAGHLANTQGGFIGSGVDIKSGSMRFAPGEWKKLPNSGGDLKNQLVPLNFPGPSTVLFQLLGMLIEASKDITATKDILTGDTGGQQQAVGTTLALIEQGLKVFTAIYKRVHRALKQEYGKLYRLNGLFLEQQDYFNFQDVQGVVARQDYLQQDVGVIPVSDPSIVTDMQRIGRAQFLMNLNKEVPGVMDPKVVVQRSLEAGGIADTEQLFPKQQPPNPQLILETMKVENEGKKIDLERFKAETERMAAVANADNATAQARKTTLEGAQIGDMAEAAVFVDQTPASGGVHSLANQQQGQPDGQGPGAMGPGDVPGMAGPPADGAAPGLSEGPPGGPGQAMGDGGGDGAGIPAVSPPVGPTGGPGVA